MAPQAPTREREAMRNLHRVVGHYLAIYAWSNNADCIKLQGHSLKEMLGLERFKEAHWDWFKEDINPWFPHASVSWKKSHPMPPKKSTKLLVSITVSRFPILSKSTPDPRRINFGVGEVESTEAGIRRHLTSLSSGLSATREANVGV
ncbi:MAG: hypothetical protein K8U57_25430 [Planctomycetes bacterium]|nr:hypothetical protein [Planctomycetota bacterium]